MALQKLTKIPTKSKKLKLKAKMVLILNLPKILLLQQVQNQEICHS